MLPVFFADSFFCVLSAQGAALQREGRGKAECMFVNFQILSNKREAPQYFHAEDHVILSGA